MISIITTCDPARFHLLRSFVAHYRAYGVEAFYINLHFDTVYPVEVRASYLAGANNILADIGLSIHSVYACPFDAMAIRRHHDLIQARIATSSPWIVSADLDEFHEFPDGLHSLVSFLESHSLDFTRGCFVDRMARNGFPEVQEGLSLWKQFPLGTDMTQAVLGGWIDKITLARSRISLLPGNHRMRRGTFAKPMAGFHPIHHFKWDASVLPRLRRRLEKDWKERCTWWDESERALQWIEGGAGGAFTGLKVFDFCDDHFHGEGGPLSDNANYQRNGFLEKLGVLLPGEIE
jgi:hypothetical protein